MKQTFIIVGSGITGLISALRASEIDGAQVTIVSKSPDPRMQSEGIDFQSATLDGSYNRFITSTEGHPYLDLPGYATMMYEDVAKDFVTTVQEGGILGLPKDEFDEDSRAFLEHRAEVNTRLRTDSVFAKEYETYFEQFIAENLVSMRLWYEDMIRFLKHTPELQKTLSLAVGINRMFDSEAVLESSAKTARAHGVFKRITPSDKLLKTEAYAAFHSGIKKGTFLKGGLLSVHGLGFNIKALMRYLLNVLEERGVRLYFGEAYEVTEIERDETGAVTRLRTHSGETFSARHILFHGGAYTNPSLFKDTEADRKIAGVQGFWMNITGAHAEKIIEGMGKPPIAFSAHGAKVPLVLNGNTYCSQVVDPNIMPVVSVRKDGTKEYTVCFGNGYLFVGRYPFENFDAERQAKLQEAEELIKKLIYETARHIFDLDADYESVINGRHPDIEILNKGCVRSWSADDRELQIIERTKEGGIMFIHGGSNTGGATKAQYVSRATIHFMQRVDSCGHSLSPEELKTLYAKTARELRREQDDVTPKTWEKLDSELRSQNI